MSHDHFNNRPFPRGALFGAATMIVMALSLATYVRLSGIDITSMPPPQNVVAKNLRFEDRPNGAVAVYEEHANEPIQVLPPASNGFLRALMRSLVRERREHGIGSAAPFRLSASPDGRLMLDDPATGRRIELEAFGRTNASVFASFLNAAPMKEAAAQTAMRTGS